MRLSGNDWTSKYLYVCFTCLEKFLFCDWQLGYATTAEIDRQSFYLVDMTNFLLCKHFFFLNQDWAPNFWSKTVIFDFREILVLCDNFIERKITYKIFQSEIIHMNYHNFLKLPLKIHIRIPHRKTLIPNLNSQHMAVCSHYVCS